MKYKTIDDGLVVVDEDTGKFFIGLGQWDAQLRKAKIYHSELYANKVKDLPGNKDKNLSIVPVKMTIE